MSSTVSTPKENVICCLFFYSTRIFPLNTHVPSADVLQISMVVCMMTFQQLMRRNGGLFVVPEAEEEDELEEVEGEVVP